MSQGLSPSYTGRIGGGGLSSPGYVARRLAHPGRPAGGSVLPDNVLKKGWEGIPSRLQGLHAHGSWVVQPYVL